MEPMIEHTATFKLIPAIAKGIIWSGVALGFVPAFDFVVLQVQQENVFISEFGQAILNDVKIVFGALVPVLVVIKLIYEIKKSRKK